jgi:putative redox protein
MKAIARRTSPTSFTHQIDVRQHQVIADEPVDHGGDDEGPSPQELLAASLASCTAVTMEMYAKRKGWDLGPVEVAVEYTPAERGCPTVFKLTMRLPSDCDQEQVERLQVIASKCPVHRTLDGEVLFEDRIELVQPAAR